MGVTNLWQLLSASASSPHLDTLSHLKLAVDVSIWLNQVIKGMRDKEGNTLQNAHLICIYSRLCKLLYFKVKPIFVFDGATPQLKIKTCAKRKEAKKNASKKVERLTNDKRKALLKQFALAEVTGTEPPMIAKNRSNVPINTLDAMFVLEGGEESTVELIEANFQPVGNYVNHNQNIPIFDPSEVDPFSDNFRSLPPDIQHEQILELIEHNKYLIKTKNFPENHDSSNFSDYQIKNVITKNNLTKRLKEVREELNNTQTSQDGKYKVHSLKLASDPNTEIVFTKLINDQHFNMLGMKVPVFNIVKDNPPLKPFLKATIKSDNSSNNDTKTEMKEESNSDVMRSLFFDEHSSKSEESDKEDDIRTERNVLGSAHPGQFINPYIVNSRKVGEVNTKNLFTELGNTLLNAISEDDSDEEAVSQSREFDIDPPYMFSDVLPQDNIKALPLPPSAMNVSLQVSDDHITVTEIMPTVDVKFDENYGLEEIENEHAPIIIGIGKSSQQVTVSLPIIEDIPNMVGKLPNDTVIEKISAPLEPHISPDVPNICEEEKDEHHTLDNTEIFDFIQTFKQTPHIRDLTTALNTEIEQLSKYQRGQKAVAAKITGGIVQEVKLLLKMFGIPFIDAPGEAEAQCAELCRLKLCDGVITDDSDIFLFGNVIVYRNVFRTGKEMELYSSNKIDQSLGLGRSRLIELAQLLGSDYCDGITGVGPVTALEILSEFGSLDNFVAWKKTEMAESELKKFRKFEVSGGFPSEVVTNAYLNPSVNSSTEEFSWAKPDVALIKDYLCKKLHWSNAKIDDTLLPVLEKMESNTIQPSITKFFSSELAKASVRVTAAAKKLKKSPQKFNSQKTKNSTVSKKSEPKSRKRKLSRKVVPKGKKFQGLSSEESD